MPSQQALGPDINTRKPRHLLPPGSTDCHCHTFEEISRYPLVKNPSHKPASAPISDYLRMCDTVGIYRTVQINASPYGFDNSISLDVIAHLGQHRARGIAGIQPGIGNNELDYLHAGGIRGARLSTKVKGYGGMELIDAVARKIKPLGWHLDLHFGGVAEIADLELQFLRLPVAVVFDHMGGVRAKDGVRAPGFQALLRIMRQRDDCWVKISSWYRASELGPPGWIDMKPMAQALVEAHPDRVVWGSNWPHTRRYEPGSMPNDGDLVDAFCDWFPDPDVRERIFVTNATKLYQFEDASDKGK